MSVDMRIMVGLFFYKKMNRGLHMNSSLKYKFSNKNFSFKNKKNIKITTTSYKINNALTVDQELKKYYSYNDIIKKINKCIPLTLSDTVLLESFLKKNNYFRFSIYVKLMKSSPNISISDVIDTYYLDQFVRDKLNYFINKFEILWKTTTITSLCNNYSTNEDSDIKYLNSQCYLDPDIYISSDWANRIISNFDESFNKNNSPTYKHHRDHKKYCLPIWALFEEITFGQLTTFITQIKIIHYNNWALETYNNPKYKRALRSWVNVIRAYRNKIAHHSRIYKFKTTEAPSIINNDSKIYFSNSQNIDNDKLYLYGCLYVIKHLLIYEDSFTQNAWNNFLNEFNQKINSISTLDKANYGLPDNWDKILKIVAI